MENIVISLTEWQMEMLRPLFDELDKMEKSGKYGGVLAQVWDKKDSKQGFLDVRVMDENICKDIQRVTGQKVGMIPKKDKVWTVLEPLDDVVEQDWDKNGND